MTGLRLFAAANRCVAAIEFAIAAPLLFMFIVGVFDVSKVLILKQQVYNTAHTMPLSASIMAVQPDRSTSLTPVQADQLMSMIYAEMPWLRSGVETGPKALSFASVVFLPNPSSCVESATVTCTYVPNVAWTLWYSGTTGTGHPSNATTSTVARYRSCGTLKSVAPSAYVQSDLTSLPTGNVTSPQTPAPNSIPSPVLVVDVYYQYTPLFFNFITGPISLYATGMWPIRSSVPGAAPSTTYTKFDPANILGGLFKCPGFP